MRSVPSPGLDGIDLVAVPEQQHGLAVHAHLLAGTCGTAGHARATRKRVEDPGKDGYQNPATAS